MSFRKRVGLTTFSLLVSLDQLAQTLLVAPFAIAGVAPIPSPDDTISEVVGRAMLDKKKWAILPCVLIDALFLVITLGTERNHCVDSVRSM